MRIDVDVINQDLLIPPEIKYVVEGTQEFIEFHFNLKSGWEDLTIFAQFIQEGTGYNVFLDENNSACLPPEIVNGYVQIVLYGVYGDIIAVSHFLRLRVQRTPFISDGQSTEITQSLYDQLVTEVTDFETEMNELMATKADKTTVNELSNRVGSLSSLTTTTKTSIVAAINELKSRADTNANNIGTLSNLNTTNKSNLVSAVNEVNTNANTNATNIGTLSNLTTTDKSSLVSAINEVKSTAGGNIGDLSQLTTTDKSSLVGAINEVNAEADQNAEDIADLEERKANIDGYYEQMTVGTSEQLLSNMFLTEDAPYQFRTAGGALEIADRETDMLVGASMPWNQLVQNGDFADGTNNWQISNKATASVSDNVLTLTSNAISSSTQTIPIVIGHKYLFHGKCSATNTATFGIYRNGGGIHAIVIPTDGNKHDLSIIIEASGEQTDVFDIRFRASTAESTVITAENINVIDLTRAFGNTIAGYIRSLEQATAGAGVAKLKSWGFFSKDYYEYNAGSIESVKASAHKMTGFNQFDKSTAVDNKRIRTSDGTEQSNTAWARSDYIRVLPNTVYYTNANGVGQDYTITKFDESKNYLGSIHKTSAGTFNTADAYYIILSTIKANVSVDELVLNLHWDGERDGEYEEYKEWTYPLDSDLELRGIPKLDTDNNLVYDGDTYKSDGTVTRKYGVINLGAQGWVAVTVSGHQVFYSNISTTPKNNAPFDVMCAKYTTTDDGTYANDKTIRGYGAPTFSRIYIRDDSYATAADLRTALAGVMCVYELATPTTETADTFTNPQIVDNWGTEEYVTTSVVPVGHSTKYPPDLKAKLEVSPESPDADGLYLMHRESGQNSYAPYIPQDISGKANIDGYYEDMTVGRSENFVTNLTDTELEPFIFRTSGGSLEIGDREELKVVGGSVAWNQLVNPYNLHSSSEVYGITRTVETVGGINKLHYTGTSTQTTNFTAYAAPTTNVFFATHVILFDFGMVLPNGCTINYGGTSKRYYIYKISTTTSSFGITITSGTTVDFSVSLNAFDLTQMFGTTIADYIYNLEQSTAGAGVAFFKKYFPKDYYPYNAGEMLHVQTSEFKTVGFNQWDEEWRNGTYVIETGEYNIAPNRICNKNPIPVLPNTQYYFYLGSDTTGSGAHDVLFLDADKNFISTKTPRTKGGAFTTPSNCHFINFGCWASYGATYKNDICINLYWDGTRDGEYEPYTEHSYPLDDSLTLRGIPKLDADNNLYYDGDTYEHDGTVTRRYGIVDLGTLTWVYEGDEIFRDTIYRAKFKGFGICSKYQVIQVGSWSQIGDKQMSFTNSQENPFLRIRDSSMGTDATAFKNAMSGVMLVYELATPTTETAEPYQTPQIVDNWGTEEFVVPTQSGVEIPVGHETVYPISLRDKLESAPNLPDGDGDYIMRMSSGEASYVKLASQFPAPPTENGNYVLKATVTNGTATLSWEVQS